MERDASSVEEPTNQGAKMAKMDFKMTADELEKRLAAIKETEDSFEPVRSFACCYAPVGPEPKPLAVLQCSACGKELPHIDFETIEKRCLRVYKDIAKEFRDLGYEAEIRAYCVEHDPCGGDEPSNLCFAFKAEGQDAVTESKLDSRWCETEDLTIALEFIRGARSIQALDGKDVMDSFYEQPGDYMATIGRVLGIGRR